MTNRRFEIIATAFDKKRRILSTSVNSYSKSHTLQKLYAMKAGESEMKIFLHAETSALLRAGDKEVYSILVQRFDAKGNPALAMPCKACQLMLKDFGVKYVEYTTPSGIITWEVQDERNYN